MSAGASESQDYVKERRVHEAQIQRLSLGMKVVLLTGHGTNIRVHVRGSLP